MGPSPICILYNNFVNYQYLNLKLNTYICQSVQLILNWIETHWDSKLWNICYLGRVIYKNTAILIGDTNKKKTGNTPPPQK